MNIAVIRLPGTNCDLDTLHVLNNVVKVEGKLVWHKDSNLEGYDAIILPGGFSYGDYLRAGAIAAHSPVVKEVKKAAEEGKPVLGICNGFQILSEAGLLPGALLRNSNLKFVCRWVRLKVESGRTAFSTLTPKGSYLRMPVAHNEGRFFISEEELAQLIDDERVVYRYVDETGSASEAANPNGSLDNIAGVCNAEGNVVGLMPHPERASEKILSPYGSDDGRLVFESVKHFLLRRLHVA